MIYLQNILVGKVKRWRPLFRVKNTVFGSVCGRLSSAKEDQLRFLKLLLLSSE